MSKTLGQGLRGCLLLCRYQLVLLAEGGDLLFQILETDDSKQLPHITLAFKPGNDMATKQVCGKHANAIRDARHSAGCQSLLPKLTVLQQFLALCLSQVKSSCEDLSKELTLTEASHADGLTVEHKV